MVVRLPLCQTLMESLLAESNGNLSVQAHQSPPFGAPGDPPKGYYSGRLLATISINGHHVGAPEDAPSGINAAELLATSGISDHHCGAPEEGSPRTIWQP